MSGSPNALGEFLRARRELVTPEQAGLKVSGTRRVAGLRREEVAVLANISSEYYLRLEQGRYRNPSPHVLDAVARALQLDDESAEFLRRLAAPGPRRRTQREAVPRGVQSLVAGLNVPAYVEGRFLDVLAANALATALSPRLAAGRNRLRDVFLDPGERVLFADWEVATEGLVAAFRESVGAQLAEAEPAALIAELVAASPRFGELWERHDLGGRRGREVRLQHPDVGELLLRREWLTVSEDADLTVAVFHAEEGSESAAKLARLVG